MVLQTTLLKLIAATFTTLVYFAVYQSQLSIHISISYSLFGSIIIILMLHLCVVGRQLIFLFQPSLLLVTAVSLLIAIGGLGFHHGWALTHWIEQTVSWQNLEIHLTFFYVFFLLMIFFYNRKKLRPGLNLPGNSRLKIITFAVISILASVAMATVNLPFASQVVAVGFIGYCLHICNIQNLKTRMLLYLTLFIPIALLLHDDKRDAIFLLFPLFIIELLQNPEKKLNFKSLFTIFYITFGVLIMIVLATVLRAAEYYEINKLIDIFSAARTYVFSELFLGYFLQNIEATYTYFHTINAIEMWTFQKLDALSGGSYVKAFFVTFPREIFDFKPQKASYWYTLTYDEKYRLSGGSWAVSMFGEAYLNFQIFGALILVSILKFFDYLFYSITLRPAYKNYMINIMKLYLPVAFLDFSRGAGLDSIVIYLCVVMFASLILEACLRYR